MVDDALNSYSKKLKCIEIPSQAKITRWALEYRKNGSETAFDLMVVSQLRLVTKIAGEVFHIYHVPEIEELIGDGNVGLMKAVEKYNPDKGTLPTYATNWIKAYCYGSVIRWYNRNFNWITSEPARLLFYKFNKTVWSLSKNGEQVDFNKISDALMGEVTPRQVENFVNAKVKIGNLLSLSQPIGGKADSQEIGETVSEKNDLYGNDSFNYEQATIREETRSNVNALFAKFAEQVCNPKMKKILYERLVAEKEERKTLEQIGEEVGISKEGVRQREIVVMKKLKEFLKREGKKDILC